MDSKPVLAYWNIRGLAQPIRLLLVYAECPFEDKHYVCGPPPDFDKTCWFGIKNTLGLDFPNLPYYLDGDTKITQSNAILRHLGRKYDLCGKSEQEKIRVDVLENQAMDFRNGLVRLCYNPNFANLEANYKKDLPNTLGQFSHFLGDLPWFAGQNLTFVDFILYELLDQHLFLDATCLDGYKNIKDFIARFEKLPSIEKYFKSDAYMKWPLNNKMARFGGETSESVTNKA